MRTTPMETLTRYRRTRKTAGAAMVLAAAGASIGALLPLPALAQDKGLPITPGLWRTETKTVTAIPLLGSDPATSNEECVRRRVFEPEELVQGIESCTIENLSINAPKMSFEMVCQGDGPEMRGLADYKISGGKGSGTVRMEVPFGAKTFEMIWQFTATRLGDC
ncbi:MAG: DUF3617 family protein [Pseudomonadota bacterium]